MAKDYYGILNISRDATEDQIKKAYRKLAIKYHPDKNKSAAAEERFKEIAEAYELLTDRRKRSSYDQFGSHARNTDDMSDCRNPKGGIFTYHFHGDPRATFAQFFGAANPFGAFYAPRKASHKFKTSAAKDNETEANATSMKAPAPSTPPPPTFQQQKSNATTTNTTPPTTKFPTSTPAPAPPSPSPPPTSQPQKSTASPAHTAPPTAKFTNPIPAPAPPTPKFTNPIPAPAPPTPPTPTPPPPSPPSRNKPQLKQDPPIEYDLYVTLEDIDSGCTKKMRILRMVIEEDGQKRKEEKVLNINVKPGWKEGTKITFQREGDRLPDMIPADIVFIIRDKPHPIFKREGRDIRYTAVVSLKRALCGTDIQVPTLQGDHILINTHGEIVIPNTVKRLSGRGLPYHKEPNKRGDLLVDIVVKFPEMLPANIKEKLIDILPD